VCFEGTAAQGARLFLWVCSGVCITAELSFAFGVRLRVVDLERQPMAFCAVLLHFLRVGSAWLELICGIHACLLLGCR